MAYSDMALAQADRELKHVKRAKLANVTADAAGMMSALYAQLIGVELPAYLMKEAGVIQER